MHANENEEPVFSNRIKKIGRYSVAGHSRACQSDNAECAQERPVIIASLKHDAAETRPQRAKPFFNCLLQGMCIGSAWVLFYGILSAFAPGIVWLLILRFLLGLGLGSAAQA